MLNKDDLNERSQFGKDEFFDKLRREIPNADADAPIYEELFNVIENDVKPRILADANLVKQVDDLMQEIKTQVYISIPRYLQNPDFFTLSEEEWKEQYDRIIASGILKETDKDPRLVPPELRRQSWLSKLTENTIKKYIAKQRKQSGLNPNVKYTPSDVESIEVLKEVEQNDYEKNPQRELDETYNGKTEVDEEGIEGLEGKDPKLLQDAMDRSADRVAEKKIPSGMLIQRLEQACSLRSDPDRLMGFIYACIIIPLQMGKLDNEGRTRSGKPKATSRKLRGKRLSIVFESMKEDLDDALEKELPDSIYSKLEARLDKVVEGEKQRDKLFNLTAANIADASHRVNNRIDQIMDAIHAEEEKTEDKPENDNNNESNNKRR